MRFTTACCLSRSPGRTLTTLFTALASVCLEYNGLNTKESLVVWETIANQTCSHPSSCYLAPLLCVGTLAVLCDGFQEKSPSLSCSLTLVFGPFVRNLCVWFRDTSLSSSSRDRDSFSPVPLLWEASFRGPVGVSEMWKRQSNEVVDHIVRCSFPEEKWTKWISKFFLDVYLTSFAIGE